MRKKRTTRLGYQAAACGLCHGPIDLPSGFWFDTEESLGIVHPDCLAYFLTYDKQPTRGVIHTCGNPLCMRPDHLEIRVLEA